MRKEPLPAGVHVALATPFTPEYDVDVPAVRRLVEHVVEGGIHGLNVMGSTGEVASLSQPRRRLLVDTVVDAAAGRVPIIAAVAQNSLDDAMREIDALARQGVGGALVTAPSYYPLTPLSVESYYRSLAAGSALPLLIYHIPQFTKVFVPPETVAALARDGIVVGIKDSSRDFEYFSQVVFATRGIEGFRAFTGSDTMLLASLVLGASGTIAGGPNLAPRLAVELFQAFHAGEWARARDLQQRVLRLVLATRKGMFPAGIKAGLEILGVCRRMTAPPVLPYSDDERAQLEAVMRELDLVPSPVASRRAA